MFSSLWAQNQKMHIYYKILAIQFWDTSDKNSYFFSQFEFH